MYHSRSAPGLGRGLNRLREYRCLSVPTLSLSPEEEEEEEEEEEAERLYYAAISASLTKDAFTILAKDLSKRSTKGSAYLTWLIMHRGRAWPGVAAA